MTGLPAWSEGKMPGLLVSVRSAEEARQAVLGGATVIDVKEPSRGPLGRAKSEVWRLVRAVVPRSIPVSAALGELAEWDGQPVASAGISFLKLGFAGAGSRWRARWNEILELDDSKASWVAVAYADWEAASAPDPWEVLEAAIEAPRCAGILVDTWNKTKPTRLTVSPVWSDWVARSRSANLFVSLAGGLGESEIRSLGPLQPDLFAVRGAACDRGSRDGDVKAAHVARLIQVIRESRS